MAKHYYKCPYCETVNEIDVGGPRWHEAVQQIRENLPAAVAWAIAIRVASVLTEGVGGLVLGGIALTEAALKVDPEKIKQFLDGHRATCASCGRHFRF